MHYGKILNMLKKIILILTSWFKILSTLT